MKLLFISQGYARVVGPDTGLGKYLREMCLGLMARGHECHVLVWAEGEVLSVMNSGQGLPCEVSNGLLKKSSIQYVLQQDLEGVKIFYLAHAYWPFLERVMPDSRDEWNMRRVVRLLDAEYRYSRIEIQSEEGIALGVLKDFPKKCVMRIHTTMADMVRDKQVVLTRKVRHRLARERRSFLLARTVVTHSELHAELLSKRLPELQKPQVVSHGCDLPLSEKVQACREAGDPLRILIVGTPDLRKGYDRIMPVLRAIVSMGFPCIVCIVARCAEEVRRRFGFCPPYPEGLSVEWREGVPIEELMDLYAQASVLLQLSRYESFGWPLVEAASQGTPVVSTAVGVAPELLEGELEGCLVNGDDPIVCARVILDAIRDRERISAYLKKRYFERHTRDKMVTTYLEKLGMRDENHAEHA